MAKPIKLIKDGDLKGLPVGSEGVDLRAKQTAYATLKHPLVKTREMKEGCEITAHPHLIEHFAQQGFVTNVEPEEAF